MWSVWHGSCSPVVTLRVRVCRVCLSPQEAASWWPLSNPSAFSSYPGSAYALCLVLPGRLNRRSRFLWVAESAARDLQNLPLLEEAAESVRAAEAAALAQWQQQQQQQQQGQTEQVGVCVGHMCWFRFCGLRQRRVRSKSTHTQPCAAVPESKAGSTLCVFESRPLRAPQSLRSLTPGSLCLPPHTPTSTSHSLQHALSLSLSDELTFAMMHCQTKGDWRAMEARLQCPDTVKTLRSLWGDLVTCSTRAGRLLETYVAAYVRGRPLHTAFALAVSSLDKAERASLLASARVRLRLLGRRVRRASGLCQSMSIRVCMGVWVCMCAQLFQCVATCPQRSKK